MISARKIGGVTIGIFCMALMPTFLIAQNDSGNLTTQTRNIAWFTPCAATKINGLAAGLQAITINSGTLTINGMNADIGFGALTVVPHVIIYSLTSNKKRPAAILVIDTAKTGINGISLSFGGELGVSVNGVNIAGGVTAAATLNGISITGVYSKCNVFRGICISGLNNIAIEGAGLQIGLFNYCKELKGLQIGLWNKSGKRGLPIFNWGT